MQPPYTRRGRLPTFSVVKNEMATKVVWTALLISPPGPCLISDKERWDLLDCNCRDERLRLTGLLEEVGGVTKHHG